jgi:phosphomannomutase
VRPDSSSGRSARPRRIERPSLATRPILFGTSGWRGALGEEVTFPRLRVLVRAVATWIHEQQAGRRVLVGWDTRFASQSMAEMTAAVLSESGLVPVLSDHATPTPVLTHALSRGPEAAALMLTASHNPARDHGLKVFGASGGTIRDVDARRIESIAMARLHDDGPALSSTQPLRRDFRADYRAALRGLLDHDAFERSAVEVVYDAMHGRGAGILDAVLESAGAVVRRLRTNADPTFGGTSPDPVPERLSELSTLTAATAGVVLGLATDGDADRFGVVDGRGRVLSETQVVALLVDHLATTGKVRRGIALTLGTGTLVDKVARDHGLRVERHPVGFKHLSEAITAGRVDVAGEESGGFALASMGPDKDGLLAGCILANLVATSGEPLETHVGRLESRHGRSACGRRALARTASTDDAFDAIGRNPPARLDDSSIEQVEVGDSLRFDLADGGFLMFRRSGTEPMMRIYAEAKTQSALEKRLEYGCRVLEGLTKPS